MTEILSESIASANEGKANFNDIYRSQDPREYFRILGGLDYIIPQLAKPVFLQIARRLIAELGRPITILDVGCSYGVNAALLTRDLDFATLKSRYSAPSLSTLSSDALSNFDHSFYTSWPKSSDICFVGFDNSAPALNYAKRVGLLDGAIAADLETGVLVGAQCRSAANADLIISTGCIGYVTHRTLAKLAACATTGRTPWIASFVLRIFPFGDIAHELSERGLETEKFEGATFEQRRFRTRREQAYAIRALRKIGLDPRGKEGEGRYHAEFYLSRPAADIARTPLSDILHSPQTEAHRLAI